MIYINQDWKKSRTRDESESRKKFFWYAYHGYILFSVVHLHNKKTCKIASFYSCVTTSYTGGVGVGVALNQIIFVANSCKVVRGGGVVWLILHNISHGLHSIKFFYFSNALFLSFFCFVVVHFLMMMMTESVQLVSATLSNIFIAHFLFLMWYELTLHKNQQFICQRTK